MSMVTCTGCGAEFDDNWRHHICKTVSPNEILALAIRITKIERLLEESGLKGED